MGKVAAPHLHGVTEIAQINGGLLSQKSCILACISVQRGVTLCRKRKELRLCVALRLRGLVPCRLLRARCFFDDQMGITAAQAKGT